MNNELLTIFKDMKTILKSTGKSKSGNTFYYDVKIPAGVLTIKEGVFCGSCDHDNATIDEIGWMYCFGKKFFSITINGKYQLKDYVETIKKYANSIISFNKTT